MKTGFGSPPGGGDTYTLVQLTDFNYYGPSSFHHINAAADGGPPSAWFRFSDGGQRFASKIESVYTEPPLLEESIYNGYYTLYGENGTEWELQGTILVGDEYTLYVHVPDADGFPGDHHFWHDAVESITSSTPDAIEAYFRDGKWRIRIIGNHHALVVLDQTAQSQAQAQPMPERITASGPAPHADEKQATPS